MEVIQNSETHVSWESNKKKYIYMIFFSKIVSNDNKTYKNITSFNCEKEYIQL